MIYIFEHIKTEQLLLNVDWGLFERRSLPILNRLGRGSQGVVFFVEDLKTKEKYFIF